MKSYALVQDGLVVNVVQWDGTPYTPAVDPDENGDGGSQAFGWSPPDGQTAVELQDGDMPRIGLGYSDGVFEQPPEPDIPLPTVEQIVATNTAVQAQLLTASSTCSMMRLHAST